MNTDQLIKALKGSNLYAECPDCADEFKLSKAVLFDGTRPFPPKALDIQKQLIEELADREKDFEKRKILVTKKAAVTARSVNIGKNLEKVLPTMKDFKLELPDCRVLGDPIDLITFNGLSAGRVNSINFIEVKSGNARLNEHQKQIKDAIADKKVTYQVFK